jgi:hypothetical protein
MTSVQALISEEDERMQHEFGMKVFLLADKCLMKEYKVDSKEKMFKNDKEKMEECVKKLLKYRNLNM